MYVEVSTRVWVSEWRSLELLIKRYYYTMMKIATLVGNTYLKHTFSMRFALLWSLFLGFFIPSFAQSVEGSVSSSDGDLLPFATLRVEPVGLTTMTNEEGKFALSLTPGTYTLVVQYIGYQTHRQNVQIPQEKAGLLAIVLTKSVIQLGEVKVNKSKEDPALTIIRKTIAMSPIHFREVKSYEVKNYVRVAVKVDKVPFLVKKQLKENFVTLGQTYILESVKQLGFSQPSKYTEKVLSVRSNIPPHLRGTEGVSVELRSLYDPENKQSPVTVKGAQNYRYEYVGYFEDQGQVINKIKIIPRVQGQGLWEGTIHIIDESWYVHGMEVAIPNTAGTTHLKALYQPLQGVWMPAQTDVKSEVDYLGFGLFTQAVTSYRDYRLTLDPSYARQKPKLIDAKVQPVEKGEISLQTFQKDIRKKVKKEKKSEIPVIENWSSEDSLARKRDITFWEAERMVPLTALEVRGYREADSLYVLQEEKIQKKIKEDSLIRQGKAPFEWSQIMTGYTFKRGKVIPGPKSSPFRHTFTIGSLISDARYTAVEGLNWGLPSLTYRRYFDSTHSWTTTAQAFYAFGRKQWNGFLSTRVAWDDWQVSWKVGRQMNQINPVVPDGLASFYLFALNRLESHFFQETFQDIGVSYKVSPRLSTQMNVYVGQRNSLENVIERSSAYRNEGSILPSNNPNNVVFGLDGTSFSQHIMTRLTGGVTYRPGVVLYRENGRTMTQNRGPVYRLVYQAGLGPAGFQRVEVQTEQQVQWAGNQIKASGTLGTFLGKQPTYFLDYRHFRGNELLFQTHSGFRALPVYLYSTAGGYAEGHVEGQFAKFLVTQWSFLQKRGVEETLFLNALRTKELPYYLEAGYGWQLSMSRIRVEGYRSWMARMPGSWGVRVHLPMF